MRNLNRILKKINKHSVENVTYLENKNLLRNLFKRVYFDKDFISILNRINLFVLKNNDVENNRINVKEFIDEVELLSLKKDIIKYEFPNILSVTYHDLIFRHFSKIALDLIKFNYNDFKTLKNVKLSQKEEDTDTKINEDIELDFYFLKRNISQELRYRKSVQYFFKYIVRDLDRAYSKKVNSKNV